MYCVCACESWWLNLGYVVATLAANHKGQLAYFAWKDGPGVL